jgi:hypothetical protein
MAGHRRAEATPFFERLCPAMTIGIVACESFPQRFVRHEPRLGLEGRELAQQYQQQSAVTFTRVAVLIDARHLAL